MPPWGYSCHLDISRCDKRIEVFFLYAVFTESARNTLRHFVIALVEHIKMQRYGDPVIEYFGTEEAKGWSVMQLIETSCITMCLYYDKEWNHERHSGRSGILRRAQELLESHGLGFGGLKRQDDRQGTSDAEREISELRHTLHLVSTDVRYQPQKNHKNLPLDIMVKYLDKSIYMRAKEVIYKQYDKPSH